MIKHRRIMAAIAIAAAGTMVLAGCSAVDDDADSADVTTSDVVETPEADDAPADEPEPPATEPDDEADTPDASEPDDAASEINTGEGITAEPCPDAINPDNGCIYLGILSDLTEGPFAALAVPIVDGQRAFWRTVNEAGGISGYDVDIDTYTKDTKYQAAEHASAYREIEANILAIAQTLGTVNTEAILPDMDEHDVVAVPATWWSGYAFNANDMGLMLEFGYSYCTEAIVGLDWYTENFEAPGKVAAVGYPGDYGGDSAAGAELWADANGVDDVTVIPTGPNQVTGNQDAVVGALAAAQPDVVILAVGPAETAEIVGKMAAGGFAGRFLGSLPTWNPALLGSAAAPALVGLYNHMSPSEQWDGTSPGAMAMKAANGDEVADNGGYVIGWLMSYPMHSLLQQAAANGDLTRAGVRAAIDGLEVDFDGMMPTMTYGGEGKDVAASQMMIYTPDADAPLGEKATGDFYNGVTFAELAYDQACSVAG